MAVALAAPARPAFGSQFACLSLILDPLTSCLPLRPSSLVTRGGRRVVTCVPDAICRACHEVRLPIGRPPPGTWPDGRWLCVRPAPRASVISRSVETRKAHGPSVLIDYQAGPSVPGGSRAVSCKWLTGRQSLYGSRAVSPGWHTSRQSQAPHRPPAQGGSRAVSTRVAHGPSVTGWLTGRQSPSGFRAVSPRVAHGPSVPGWLTGRQSLVTRWPLVPGDSRATCPRRIARSRVRGIPGPQALMARGPSAPVGPRVLITRWLISR